MFRRSAIEDRQTQRAAERARNLALLCSTPATRTGSYSGATRAAVPKQTRRIGASRAAEQRHKDALAQIGCMVCRRIHGPHEPGPVELHHLRADGWGKGGYLTLIPLCREHHQGATGVHGLGTRGFVKFYGFTQADLLRDALALVGGEG